MSKNTTGNNSGTNTTKIEIITHVNKDIAKNGLVSTAPPKPTKSEVKPPKK